MYSVCQELFKTGVLGQGLGALSTFRMLSGYDISFLSVSKFSPICRIFFDPNIMNIKIILNFQVVAYWETFLPEAKAIV